VIAKLRSQFAISVRRHSSAVHGVTGLPEAVGFGNVIGAFVETIQIAFDGRFVRRSLRSGLARMSQFKPFELSARWAEGGLSTHINGRQVSGI
jgi:hypothetical protein